LTPPPQFNIEESRGQARSGSFSATGKYFSTPAFAPVATAGTLKGVTTDDLKPAAFNLLLANTYHLIVRPGVETVQTLGGIHKMLNWKGLILTDSGGFQGFSLAKKSKIDPDGITFNNHVDGAPVRLTPESVILAQENMGSNIAMVLDVCAPLPSSPKKLRESVEVSIDWAKRSIAARKRSDMALFGIVQGGTDSNLRRHSATETTALNFDGYAIGGLSVGESAQDMYTTLDHTTPELPVEKIRYLMGVGRPNNIVEAVARGIDMFDCVLPTRNARNGQLFTWNGILNILRSEYKSDTRPLDVTCSCPTCKTTSRGVLRHLIKAKELNYYHHATVHNLWFMAELMAAIRSSIQDDTFSELRTKVNALFAQQ